MSVSADLTGEVARDNNVYLSSVHLGRVPECVPNLFASAGRPPEKTPAQPSGTSGAGGARSEKGSGQHGVDDDNDGDDDDGS